MPTVNNKGDAAAAFPTAFEGDAQQAPEQRGLPAPPVDRWLPGGRNFRWTRVAKTALIGSGASTAVGWGTLRYAAAATAAPAIVLGGTAASLALAFRRESKAAIVADFEELRRTVHLDVQTKSRVEVEVLMQNLVDLWHKNAAKQPETMVVFQQTLADLNEIIIRDLLQSVRQADDSNMRDEVREIIGNIALRQEPRQLQRRITKLVYGLTDDSTERRILIEQFERATGCCNGGAQ